MSTAVEQPARPMSQPGRRRRRVLTVAAAVVAVAVVVLAVVLVRADRQYGPIEQGAFGGEYSHAHIGSKPAGPSWIAGARGTEIIRMYSLENRGTHDVTVSSVTGDPVVSRVQWSPWHTHAGGSIYGRDLPARDFPATVPAGTDIRVLVTIRKPNCVRGTGYAPTLTVHWDSLLGSHTTRVEFPMTNNFYLCRP